MMKKKVDGRIRTLVENCVKLRHRALFVVIGDRAHDQVVNLHYLLSKTLETTRPSVLWCYKTHLHLSSHKAKRQKQIQKLTNKGLLDASKDDPFAVFIACTKIRYCYYHETHKILGNTFGMCVLQDFEALTPNLLAHTIETVEGGGLIVLLLSNLQSLTQLYQLTMDVHSRFKTESFSHVTGHFNERLVLSLASNPCCILMDDELNILPISSHVKNLMPVELGEDGRLVDDPSNAVQEELRQLVAEHKGKEPLGSLVAKCRTNDQAKALIAFVDAASEKTLRSTVALTAARGRGKSAAMGLAIAGTIAMGYSNIFVTAPSPENLKTLFEFVCKGLDALDYNEHTDYDLVASTNPAFNKAVVRINVFRHHRQTVQYLLPQHHEQMGQAELVVIDEAAAIPLPLVRSMLGPYLVFLCSTINGYEGTGRSLSLKLIKQIREQSRGTKKQQGMGRTLKEVILEHPIRYAPGDKIETWLNELLCLNCADHIPSIPEKLPHPDQCDVFYVERSTLFSFHKQSEFFLQQMMSLYVASHYKNTPNDLVLISDAPAHRLFVLLGPIDPSINALPDVLCVIQVNLEGGISKRTAASTLGRGASPNGDLIPWTIGQQFQDTAFPSLSGARIVRIAVHPDLIRVGYGSRALHLLEKYYEGGFYDADQETTIADASEQREDKTGTTPSNEKRLLEERITLKEDLPPLFANLSDRRPERLDYLGTSFGLTLELYNFWHKAGYLPVYIRQTRSEVTGEYTVIMVKPIKSDSEEVTSDWIRPFVSDFRRRFCTLLGGAFREMDPVLALTILNPKLTFTDRETDQCIADGIGVQRGDGSALDAYDLKRLQSYANNLIDHHLILDLVPCLARMYFSAKLPVALSYGQAVILLCLGLQMRDISHVEKAMDLPLNQVLALFSKAIRKMHALLRKTAAPPSTQRILPMKPLPFSSERDGEKSPREDVPVEAISRDLEKFKVADVDMDTQDVALCEGTVFSVKRKSNTVSEAPSLQKESKDPSRKKKRAKKFKNARQQDT